MPWDNQPGIPVLVYHEITTDDTRQPGDTVISLRNFREEMQYLAKHGYHPIGLHELAAHMQSGSPVPSRPIVLTFGRRLEKRTQCGADS